MLSLLAWMISLEVRAQPLPGEIEKMQAVIPERARVEPIHARRLLVFSRSWGYRHSAIPYGKALFRMLGGRTKAFEVVLSDELDWFERDRLETLDAVLFNNTNNEIFLPEDLNALTEEEQAEAKVRDARLKENLVWFVAGGKGLAVIHAGVASFREWPEYGEIMGARFENHPWNAGSTVTLRMEEPDHPLCRAFGGVRFEITDEIYQFKAFDRKKLRVLISLDTTGMDLARVEGIRREDGDFALCWVKPYGGGRVFYTALGHQHDLYWNRELVQHYLDGVQFALGDLKASMLPMAPRP